MMRRALDLLYPPLCELCGTLTSGPQSLCDPCRDSLPFFSGPSCQKCGEGFPGEITGHFSCPNCHNIQLDFDFAFSALSSSANARQLIHALKYQGKFYLAYDLAAILAEAIGRDPRLQKIPPDSLVTPVPLHWLRQQQRRGNQSHEIARALSQRAGFPLNTGLKRKRATKTQTRLTRKERLSNLAGTFAISPQHLAAFAGKTVLLIDDVFTTGSTTHECARVLHSTGKVEKVIVLTLIRG